MTMTIDAQQPEALQTYLRQQSWLTPAETITALSKPGEGNMNYTLRVAISQPGQPQRTVIVKQARPYVEKYPTIAAPAERAVVEGRFYELISQNSFLQGFMPQLVGLDVDNYVLLLEDLGAASDFTSLYQPDALLSAADALALTQYLSALHGLTAPPAPIFANRAMRALNHEHIFNYPFLVDNGFDLDTVQPGLQALSMPYKQHLRLHKTVAELGAVYLADGPILLHGDYYPGSWLKTTDGVRIIDPEFCFYGPAEFDLGVLLAHLKLACQPDAVATLVEENYQRPVGFDESLCRQFTGVEIMRRLIGLAQLPVVLTVEQKHALLETALAGLLP